MSDNDTRLVLHDTPVFIWILGLVFAGVGALMFLDGSMAGWIFTPIGLALMLFVSRLTVTADRITRTLKLEYRSVMRYSAREIPFDEITGIGVERISGGKGFTYRVELKCRDGQVIPLRSSSSSGSAAKQRLAQRLREFIGVPEFDTTVAGQTCEALKTYIDNVQETDGVHWQIQPKGPARWHSPDFRTPGAFLFLAQKAEGQNSHGFLGSLGSMFFRPLLSSRFGGEDTPGIDRAATLGPLDPAIEPHFMGYTNTPASAGQLLNSRSVTALANWAERYPIRNMHKSSRFGQLMILFSPNGVYLCTLNPLQPDQVNELAALGVDLVKSHEADRAYSTSSFAEIKGV